MIFLLKILLLQDCDRGIIMNYTKIRVLVLEDELLIRRIITKSLKSIGIENIFEATDGVTGLNVSYNYLPDFIICDINMTPMSGDRFITQFKTQLWNICQPKIIVVTGSTDDNLIKSLDVDLIIKKPFKVDEFISNITKILS